MRNYILVPHHECGRILSSHDLIKEQVIKVIIPCHETSLMTCSLENLHLVYVFL